MGPLPLFVFGSHVWWRAELQQTGIRMHSCEQGLGCCSFPSSFSILPPARLGSVAGLGEQQPEKRCLLPDEISGTNALEPRSRLPSRWPTLNALPLRKKKKKAKHTGLVLWTDSKQPPSPGFPLKESSAVGGDRNGIRNKAVLGSV